MSMSTSSQRSVLILILFCLLLTGCQSAMSSSSNMTPPPGHGPFTGTAADWPLWFIAHNFGVRCFDTQSCEVLYRGFPHGSDEPSPSVESFGEPLEELLRAGRGPIPNFPPPAIVTWKSKDGAPLRAEIDIGEIFKDKLIRHMVSREDISEVGSVPNPEIIVEVNDRTINVYMRAMVYLKEPRFRDRPNSDYRYDLIKVFSKTY